MAAEDEEGGHFPQLDFNTELRLWPENEEHTLALFYILHFPKPSVQSEPGGMLQGLQGRDRVKPTGLLRPLSRPQVGKGNLLSGDSVWIE